MDNRQLITVKFGGYLTDVFNVKTIQLLASNIAEVVKGITANFSNATDVLKPGSFHIYKEDISVNTTYSFIDDLSEGELSGGVIDDNINTQLLSAVKEDLLNREDSIEDNLTTPIGTFAENEVLVIVPAIEGGGGFLKIILGIALIGAALLIPGAGFLLGIGAALFLGGITSLFAPTNKTPKKYERQDSHLFNDAPQTGFDADPIPLLYGEYLITNIPYISSSITKVSSN